MQEDKAKTKKQKKMTNAHKHIHCLGSSRRFIQLSFRQDTVVSQLFTLSNKAQHKVT